MTALDATKKRAELTKLMNELDKLAKFFDQDRDLANKASGACGVIDISTRLETAQRYLDDYDSCISRALQATDLPEVIA